MLRVGKVVAAHGLSGAVIIKHILNNSNWVKSGDAFLLEMEKESYIPFFTTDVTPHKEGELLVKMEDVSDADGGKRLIGKNVYVQEDVLQQGKVDSPLLYIGFELIDREKGSLGKITDVMQAGKQWIAQIMIEEKEVLIPLAEELIIDINVKNKYIRMNVPEGLVEVYLNN